MPTTPKKTTATKTPKRDAKERVSKVGIERFAKIVHLARRKSGVTMSTLQKELEVSEASIKRDFTYLKERLHCPLEWDAKKRAHFLRDDPANGGRFELPGLWFDAPEMFALLMMLHLVKGVQPGLLEEHIAPMKDRLREILAKGGKPAKQIEKKVKLIHFAPRKVELKNFKTVATALLEGKRLRMKYFNRDKKEKTDRVISPLQLVHYRENWVLDAWCHEREALRTFGLEAVEGMEALSEPAIEVSREDMDNHFQSGYGIFAGIASNRAVIKFTPERAQWVSKETWHRNQTASWAEDGSYILEVPYSNDSELLMDIMRYGADVEVMSPPALRKRIKSILSAATKKYS